MLLRRVPTVLRKPRCGVFMSLRPGRPIKQHISDVIIVLNCPGINHATLTCFCMNVERLSPGRFTFARVLKQFTSNTFRQCLIPVKQKLRNNAHFPTCEARYSFSFFLGGGVVKRLRDQLS